MLNIGVLNKKLKPYNTLHKKINPFVPNILLIPKKTDNIVLNNINSHGEKMISPFPLFFQRFFSFRPSPFRVSADWRGTCTNWLDCLWQKLNSRGSTVLSELASLLGSQWDIPMASGRYPPYLPEVGISCFHRSTRPRCSLLDRLALVR